MGAGNNYGNRLDNRQRGNASQLLEKYRALARDAQQAGDRVTAEYYLQYADHYYRVLGDYRDKTPNDPRQRGRDFYEDDATGYAANTDDGDAGEDEDQDADRSEARSDDDGRSQWRDDRGNAPRQREGGQREGGQRENGQRENLQREPRGDGRDRQNWNGNNRARDEGRNERPRDEGRNERPRDEGRNERARDEGRGERPRDDNRQRDDQRGRDERPRDERPRDERPRDERPRDEQRVDGGRNVRRERRPESVRPAPVEAVVADEGPIPGLPGPATLRVRRQPAEDSAPPVERVAHPEPESAAVETPASAAQSAETAGEPEAAPPRRRGRPRKIVEAAPIEG